MCKQEFIDRLRMALSGKVSARLVEENISYYEEYINSQVRMGNSEEMVLSSLGDPRLIAKSIITANEGSGTYTTEEDNRSGQREEYYTQKRENNSLRVVNIPRWAAILITVLIFVVIISIVGSIISALIPFVPIVLIIVFLVKLFRDWLK